MKFHQLVYSILVPQNYHHRKQHFTRNQNPPKQITLQKQLSSLFFKIIYTIVDIFQFEKKGPHCILLHTRNPQIKEKKIFAIIEGTLFFPFSETVFTLPDAIPSNLHLVGITDRIDDNDV